MRYSLAQIDTNALAEWQTDLLVQQLAETGFDSFEQNDTALYAYIPSSLLDEAALHAVLDNNGVTLLALTECPDENWNTTWEQEHPVQHLPLGVTITPHCAFGAGHHETTSMMIDALLNCQLSNGFSRSFEALAEIRTVNYFLPSGTMIAVSPSTLIWSFRSSF